MVASRPTMGGGALFPSSAPGLAVENAMKMSPGPVPFNGPHPPQADGYSPREALQLVGRQRRIGGDYHDDGALFRGAHAISGGSYMSVADRCGFSVIIEHRWVEECLDAGPAQIHFPGDCDACNSQLIRFTIVALDEHSDRVGAVRGVEPARRGSGSSFEAVA